MAKKQVIDTSIIDRAICFATRAHQGIVRKGTNIPYIVHPIEAVAIVASMTDDQELMAAAALHDVVEDTNVTIEEIEKEFGKRVAEIVDSESDGEMPGLTKIESWKIRKESTLLRLKNSSTEAKIVALGDKLSNMRAIARDYLLYGENLWNRFNVNDGNLHAWYYRGLADSLDELKDTPAYREYVSLLNIIFKNK